MINPILFQHLLNPSAERNQSDNLGNFYKARLQLIFT